MQAHCPKAMTSPSFSEPAVPRPSHRDTSASSASRRLRRLSRRRSPRHSLLCTAAAARRVLGSRRRSARVAAAARRAAERAGRKCRLNFLLCCRCCQALLHMFFFPAFFGRCVTWPRLVWRLPVALGPHRLQRPSIRAGSHTRHPMLSASCDESWKACGRRPHLSDGFLHRPGSSTGRLHQDQGREVTQHLNTAYASLSSAPSGKTPVSRKRHRAMSNLRATATIPIRLKRLPPPPKRSRNQPLRALSG